MPSASSSDSASLDTPARAAGREWTPSDRDQLVFRWVKFEGRTQDWVAEQLEINQSTVSRMVEKYERWIAHGGPGRQGALTYDERIRAQRWLTFERNEWILSSALRIAAEMEQPCDATKSTVSRSADRPSAETEIRTQHITVDRSGVANRFLRLAHRVNMENLKLLEEEPLPPIEPLLLEEVAEPEEEHLPRIVEQPEADMAEGLAADLLEPAALESPPAVSEEPVMQATHNPDFAESLLNDAETTACNESDCLEKSPAAAYQVVSDPPETGESALFGASDLLLASLVSAGGS